MLSLYVHVPFCRSRCYYCDFASWTRLDLMRPYAAAVVKEIQALESWLRDSGPDTLYVGGGTPSLLAPDMLAQIISSIPLAPESEVTIEANPGTLTQEGLAQIRAAGFNRLSIGMQSAHGTELKLLGRTHSPDDVGRAVEWARQAGFRNVSIDLIYGIPGQTAERWATTITAALSLHPQHLSLYALSVEPRTALDRWVRSGRLEAPDPDRAAEMYEVARGTLREAGYVHYEISNWALPNYQSKHNVAYWRNRAYLGIGASAWGHWPVKDVSWRLRNVRRPQAYMARMSHRHELSAEGLPITPACAEEEYVPRPWAMAETMLMGLRLVQEGVSRARFHERFGVDPAEHYRTELEELGARGRIAWDEASIRLTREALLVSNQILTMFLPEKSRTLKT